MSLILLTGAGFSRNWGGWLASEAFEYLIGQDHIHPRVRKLLWQHKDRGGFEAVYQALKDGATNPTDQQVFRSFHMMVTGMFHTMGHGFKQALMGTSILNFLVSFDAIFTLNQDTLIELKYPSDEEIRQRSQGKFIGYETPGLQNATDQEFMPPGFYKPKNGPFSLMPGKQPYFKLHGSSNWTQSNTADLMLIIGGNKSVEIAQQPLLQWYHEQFQKMIAGAQVVIIGYSFGDEHINKYLTRAATQGTRFFIIDPMGVDIIDKSAKGVGHIPEGPTNLIGALMDNVDGASRRDLVRTFSGDNIEHGKVYHFMTRWLRK
jgi:SIR2-like domain